MHHWAWREETEAAPAAGAVGFGAVAQALLVKAQALIDRTAQPPPWQVTAHASALILTGPAETLPWVDGAGYIAPRAEAPGLWLPTTRRPDIALDLLARALARRYPQAQPLLLWPASSRTGARQAAVQQAIPLTRLLPADATRLARIAARWAGAG